jgi:hypothetical protein
MKLFSEYFAGHINHDFHLFGDDDMKFLKQFPARLWEKAIAQRYCVDLPTALLKREEARSRPLEGLKNPKGNPVQLNYYDLIRFRQDIILGNLDHRTGDTEEETVRIQDSAYDNAKNAVDMFLSERPDGGGAWMNITYGRTLYTFARRHRHGTNEDSHTIRNNYIAELVTRIEGPKGSSDRGFDLSSISNFDPSIPDDQQDGSWYTNGFTCPEKDQIIENLQKWVGFSAQSLLNEPRSIADQEAHRIRPRTRYLAGREAVDLADKVIYKPALTNYYKAYINRLEKMLETEEGIDQASFNFLRNKFNLMIETPTGTAYAYRFAMSGRFPDALQRVIGDEDAHDFTDDQLEELITICSNVHNPLERELSTSLADIDLLSYKIEGYHGSIIDPEKGTELTHPSEPNIDVEGDVIPELHSGKILFNIDVAKAKLREKIDAAIREENPELARQLTDLINRLDRENAVGHHYNVREIAEKGKKGKKRKKIFYQFSNRESIPEELDKRGLTIAGGVHPNSNFQLDVGARLTNLNNSLNQLMGYLNNRQNHFDTFVKSYIKGNYRGPYNIIFKTFVNNNQVVTHPQAYELFKKLIRDKALRNIGKFDIEEANQAETYNIIERTLRFLIMDICDRLSEKNLGSSGTKKTRIGQASNVNAVMERMQEAINDTMRG